ncbi:hypothetical protein JRG66_03995 [Salinimicrobium tongyeongense]|uniref:Uncharacterized protein n=1 Tax=Salinimicrobium tongyeongense TaxID=2809707 RepID=A0ABY6NTY6_9FLAO|nr:hypothetical protein [Salinimicrobium tongyeongense]UZH56041.1 hypothetical protein JRG66_03995 [Salinimicrobium tongyeongense]
MSSYTNSLNPFGDGQGKDTQFTRVYEALNAKSMTMFEAEQITGVRRESICRYVSRLKTANKIAVRKIRRCSITGYPYVQELTTNPNLFPQSNQLKLF